MGGSSRAIRLLAVVVCAAPAEAASAQPPASLVLDRGKLELGLGAIALNGRVRVDGRGQFDGSELALRRDLDLGGRDSSRLLALSWRPFERDEFAARARRLTRSGERLIERDVVFNGETFPINSRLRGEINLDLVSLTYTRWLLANEHSAFGLSAGALQYRLGMRLAADELPGGIQTEALEAGARADLPVLVLGGEYRQAFTKRWRGVVRAAAFKADIGRIDGWVYEVDASMEYAFPGNAVIALSVVDTQLNARSRRSSLLGELRLELVGAQMALRWRW